MISTAATSPLELRPLLEQVDFNSDGTFADIENAKKMLDFMVRHDTGSSHDPNVCRSTVPFVGALQKELERLGLEVLAEDEEYPKGGKQPIMQRSLVARIWPKGKPLPEGHRGVVLSSHTDVIPVSEENRKEWNASIEGETVQFDPFMLSERYPGRLTARGAVDMKQALVNYMAIAEMYAKDPAKLDALEQPIYLALSWGEEIGMRGVPAVNRMLHQMGADPELIIVGEPTKETLVVGHKGAAIMNFNIHGPDAPPPPESHPAAVLDVALKGSGGHSAFPERYIHAGLHAAQVIEKLEALQGQYAAETGTNEPLVNVSAFATGTAPNAVPNDASLQVQLRTDGGIEKSRMLADVKKILDDQRKQMETEAASETKWVDAVDDAGHKIRKPASVSIEATEQADTTLNTSHAYAVRYAKNVLLEMDRLQEELKAPQHLDDAFKPAYACVNAGVVKIDGQNATVEACGRSTGVLGPAQLSEMIGRIGTELDERIKAEAGSTAGVEMEMKSDAKVLPSQDTPEKRPVLKRIQAGLKELGKTEEEVQPTTEPYGTDAAELAHEFKKATTVVFGTGDIWTQGAHKPLEFITPEQLQRGPMFPLRMIYEFCLPHERNYPDPWMMPTAVSSARDVELQKPA